MLNSALSMLANRYSVIGIKTFRVVEGEKEVEFYPWDEYKKRRATEGELTAMLANSEAVAVVAGAVSCGLFCIDFDVPGFFEQWLEIVKDSASKPFIDRLVIERSVRGGTHLYFRKVGTVAGNTKLAMWAVDGKLKTAIETRGEGGCIFCHPTPGIEFVQGSFDCVPTITDEQEKVLLAAARMLDESPPVETYCAPVSDSKGERPGDLFNAKADWHEVLSEAGWTWLYKHGARDYWKRPGKKGKGASATTGNGDGNLLKVFTSNAAPFVQDEVCSKFGFLAKTKYGGDFGACAKSLFKELGMKSSERLVKASFPDDDDDLGAPPIDLVTGEVLEFNKTDLGNALQFQFYHGQNLRFCAAWNKWLVYTSGRWVMDECGGALVQQLFQSMTHRFSRRPGWEEWGTKCESKARITSALALAQNLSGIPVKPDDMDADPWVLNCPNGTVDLLTGKLRDHLRSDLCTKITGCDYDADMETPLFTKFIADITLSRPELAHSIMLFLGYCLTGSTEEQRFLLCAGSGENGKGVLSDLMLRIMGPYAADIPAELILSRHQDRGAHELESLKGIRFVKCEEPNKRRELDREFIKKMVSGDVQRVCKKYGDPYDMRPQLKLLLLANHKPNVEFDYAFKRRVLIAPFDMRLEEGKRDNNLIDKLLTEAPGILSCLVHYCQLWRKGGLTQSVEMKESLSEYEEENDTLGGFITDECELYEAYYIHPDELFTAYVKWCERNKYRPGNLKEMKTQMKSKGYKTDRAGHDQKWCFKGIRLVETETEKNANWHSK